MVPASGSSAVARAHRASAGVDVRLAAAVDRGGIEGDPERPARR
jgi:hypothetical protein